jgi:hypothetical protein
LESGDWYWRITPIYPNTFLVNPSPSKIGHFKVEQNGELHPPELIVPILDEEIDFSEKSSALHFSWKRDPEAATYTIHIASSQNLESPIISQKVTDNYYAYPISQNILHEMHYFWAVFKTDSEGNMSPLSETRSFTIMEKKPTNTAVSKVIQDTVSEDVLENIVEVPPSNIIVSNTESVAENIVEISAEEIPPEDIFPLPPLPSVTVISPANNYVFGIEELSSMSSIKFAWENLEGANQYIFSLFVQDISGDLSQIAENQGNELYYNITDISDMLDRGNVFIWRVEALNIKSDGMVDRTGDKAEFSFTIDLPEVGIIETRDPGILYGN